LLCRVFHENKDLNLKLENSFAEIACLWSMHNDMSAQPCENCNIFMVNFADLWIVHTQVASQLKGVKLELKELKACSLLLGACSECPKLKLELDDHSLKVKELETKFYEKPRVLVTSPPCGVCGTLMGKLFYATKENFELKQELLICLHVLREPM
jgi:cytidine deaminase